MNLNQTQNIRFLTPETVDILKNRQWRDASVALLKCTVCGKHTITGPIVAFFSFRGEDLQCYSCQKISHVKEIALAAPLLAEKVVEKQTPKKTERKYEANKNFRDFENEKISDKQITLLRQLIIEKIEEGEREIQLDSIGEMTKVEGSRRISALLSNAF